MLSSYLFVNTVNYIANLFFEELSDKVKIFALIVTLIVALEEATHCSQAITGSLQPAVIHR